ncbi:putative centromere DNA-binding CBF3-like domain-containing protein [Phytophthora infestans]|uniref:Putative centromere DNA-binding CBF3-like domain-containing protein n=1 Tax=Phytophthora infestans TaxID=4787 RepID=A0A833WC61_PHYIN|nr:putative centromere DNA-binding CBF3-like domain-containing protein [Phytophthora infestans]
MAEAARMSVELQESINRTYAKAFQIRPKNTQRAYNSRQREFLDWCAAKGPAFSNLTRTTVTDEKLHLFLEECVIGRSKRHKNENGCLSTERQSTIGRFTVSSYFVAMVDLWKKQVQPNINSNPSPRNEAVKALLKVTEYEEDERKRKVFEDRGVDTMLDGYTTTD